MNADCSSNAAPLGEGEWLCTYVYVAMTTHDDPLPNTGQMNWWSCVCILRWFLRWVCLKKMRLQF